MAISRNLYNLQKLYQSKIDRENYTSSLVSAAYRMGLLSKRDVADINRQIDQIVFERRSPECDIKKTRADVMYIIDAAMLSYPGIGYAVSALQTKTVFSLFALGEKKIRSVIIDCGVVLSKLKKSELDIEDALYKSAHKELVCALSGANISNCKYDISIPNYPLASLPNGTKGIVSLYHYAKKLYSENEFCRRFDPDEIEDLLIRYDIDRGIQNKKRCVNIFSLVLKAALLSKEPGQIHFATKDEKDAATEKFEKMPLWERREIFFQTAALLCDKMSKDTLKYVENKTLLISKHPIS
ncbi:MAG: hypothetical protein J5922_04115 [Clostridia bacterium]|nr:hypothetical protein [Clostridia bacterium]